MDNGMDNGQSMSQDTGSQGGYQAPAAPAPQAAPAQGAQPSYATQEALNEAYRSMESGVDKRFTPFNEKITQLETMLQSFAPLQRLAGAMQPQTQQPTHPVYENPVQSIIQLHEQLAEMKKMSEATKSDYEMFKQEQIAHQTAASQMARVNEEFSGQYDTESLKRAQGLAATVHKDEFNRLYQVHRGDAVKAFDDYLFNLKHGRYSNTDPQAQGVVNALNRAQIMANKAAISSSGNPNGNMGSINRQPSALDLAAITFG